MVANKPPSDRERKAPDATPRGRADQESRDRQRTEPEFQPYPRDRLEPASPVRAKTEPASERREPKAPSLRGDRPPAAEPQVPRDRQAPMPPARARTEPDPERREPRAPSLGGDRPRTAPEAPPPRQPQEPTPPARARTEPDPERRERVAPSLRDGPQHPGEAQEFGSAKGIPKPARPKPKDDSEPLVLIEVVEDTESHVALLTLNAPKIRNALTAEMRTALRGALETLAADDTVQVLIVTGAEGNFCAGGDVRTMGETDAAKIRARMTEVAETAEAVAAFPKPVIAAVAGHAAGAGVSLACLADIVVAEEDAQFTFSFLRLALGPDWGLSWSLPRRVGATRARGLILARGAIDAEEAQHIGLVDHIAEDSALDAAVALAKEMCNGPREATASVKTMLTDLAGLRAALDAETTMQLARFPAREHQEGAAAFREKRAPDYTKKR